MQFNNRFNKKTKGFTLMEVLVVLLIGAVIMVLVTPRNAKLFGRSETTFETQNIVDLISNIKGMRDQGSYGASGTNLIPQLIANDGLPDSLNVNSGVVTNTWGGAVTAVSTGIGFTLSYAAPIPQAACVAIATKMSNSMIHTTKINGGSAVTGRVSQAQATTDCAASTANTIVFTSVN